MLKCCWHTDHQQPIFSIYNKELVLNLIHFQHFMSGLFFLENISYAAKNVFRPDSVMIQAVFLSAATTCNI